MINNLEIESSLVTCLRDDYSNDFRPVESKITANLIVQDSSGFKSLFGEAGEDHVNGIIARAELLRGELRQGEEIILAAA